MKKRGNYTGEGGWILWAYLGDCMEDVGRCDGSKK
jgi:hypothetical protein